MMQVANSVKSGHKVVGYFSYTASGLVFCDGQGCIIAGSRKKMQLYLSEKPNELVREGAIIRKTRFGEIMEGLAQTGAYAFDEASYSQFLELAKKNGMNDLPDKKAFKGYPVSAMHFIRIQMVG